MGMFWCAEADIPGVGFAISREWAVDHGLADAERYPSWAKYPDERDLPVGVAARAAWKVREAGILASNPEPEKRIVTKKSGK